MTHPSGIPLGGNTGDRLNKDVHQIERMESDLIAKAKAALTAHSLKSNVHGVFSLDDLETKLGSDLCNHIGIGIGFLRIEPTPAAARSQGQTNVTQGRAVEVLDYRFGVILAVPTSDQCNERKTATAVLTALRFGIMGSTVAGDTTNRTWAFVQEGPDISASTDTMLYYSQVWRFAMPSEGNF